ncbi:acyltransferase [bacterium]|jgi:acetyltransferase-like isoleucine patch superfamily enzyme|nr:acyltransferase [bacterium]
MINKIIKFTNWPLSKKIRFVIHEYHKIKTQIFYKIIFKSLKQNSIIINPLFITAEYISVGQNVLIMNDARIEGVDHYANKRYSPHIILADGVTIQQRCHITAADNLKIGKNTTILFDVMITNIDHEYEDLTKPIANQPLKVKKTQIGENCFIGSGAKIQAGTILGRHCVVGTNAVVRGQFPDYSVIVGVPAGIVKRYDEETKKWKKTNSKGDFINE